MSNIQQGQKVQQKTLTLSDNHFAEMSDNSNDTKNKKRIELPSETQTSFKRQSKPYHDDIAETKAITKSGRSSEIIDDLKKSSKNVSKQGGWHEDTKFPPAPTTSDGHTTARDNRNDMYSEKAPDSDILDLCEVSYSDDDLEVAKLAPANAFKSTPSVASLPHWVSHGGYGHSKGCDRMPLSSSFEGSNRSNVATNHAVTGDSTKLCGEKEAIETRTNTRIRREMEKISTQGQNKNNYHTTNNNSTNVDDEIVAVDTRIETRPWGKQANNSQDTAKTGSAAAGVSQDEVRNVTNSQEFIQESKQISSPGAFAVARISGRDPSSRPMTRRKDPPVATTTMTTKADLLHKNDANDEMAKAKAEIRPYRATLSGVCSSRFKTTGEETIDNLEVSSKKVDGQVGWQDSKLPSVPTASARMSEQNPSRKEQVGHSRNTYMTKGAAVAVLSNNEVQNKINLQGTHQDSEHMSRPGAFAIAGISGGSNAWESNFRLTVDGEDESVEEMPGIGQENTSTCNIGVDEHYEPIKDITDITVDVINEDTLHDDIRRKILSQTPHADVLTIDDDEEKANQLRCIYYWAFSLLVALGLVIGLSVGLTRDDISSREDFQTASPTIAPTHNPLPTLELIQNNDYIHCGIQWIPALEIDLCRAMAAAILGDPDKFQATTISWADRWVSLEEDRRVDVLTIGNTYTMNRDVYRGETKTGFTFSDPYVYDGLVFEGIPEYVECIDRLDTYFDNCFGVRVCAVEGTVSVDFLTDHVDDFNIRLATDYGDMYQMFVDGKCNVIAVYTFDNSEFFIRQKNYTGNYTKGKNYFTNEPISVATRQGDPEFSGFVNWVMRALIAAEEQNITNVTASNFTTAAVFGEEYKNMFVNAIQAVGNYGDIYKKHLEPISPRTSSRMNLLNNGSTGLHYSYPLGQESLDAPNPIEGSKIFEITDGRGNIRCGIMERDGFGNLVVHNSTNVTKWQGMDADYCYALSASLFQGDTSKVVFVNVTSEKSGYQALDDGKVDVFAGSRITLESDVKEESTGKGFTFSMPYFYGSDDVGGDGAMHQNPKGGIAMVTREDDAQFSDFVFWTVAATIIAEEQFITQRKSGDMVEVLGFGPRYKDMHRHAIAAVGNYAEIYNRSVENIIPRQGRNLLNTNPLGPQMVSWF